MTNTTTDFNPMDDLTTQDYIDYIALDLYLKTQESHNKRWSAEQRETFRNLAQVKVLQMYNAQFEI